MQNLRGLPLEGGGFGGLRRSRREFKSAKTLLPQSLTRQLPYRGAHKFSSHLGISSNFIFYKTSVPFVRATIIVRLYFLLTFQQPSP